jgi:hypothetical protein
MKESNKDKTLYSSQIWNKCSMMQGKLSLSWRKARNMAMSFVVKKDLSKIYKMEVFWSR